MLVILDGFGLAPAGPGNAVTTADTPNFDRYWREEAHTQLAASGRAVGLPTGQMGNSEVGHLNLGAGRVVNQSLTLIESLIESGRFFENEVLTDLFGAAKRRGNALHFMGLASRGGVHSDLTHLYALLELAKREQVAPVYLHLFTDGRDTPPDSGLGYVTELQGHIDSLEHDIKIASVTGRYYAMDRDRRWERTQQAYDAVVCGRAEHSAEGAAAAVGQAYERGETDEFVKATVVTRNGQPVATMSDGDAVFFFNFRADRARQLSYALLRDGDWQEFSRCRVIENLHYASLMEYDRELGSTFALALPNLGNTLSETVSKAGKTQYHTAETEKYAHVTFFFNAEREEPFPGEDRHIVPSPKDVATYDLKPEMSAPQLTEETLKRLETHDDAFVLLNYANPDMVGHTGVLAAAVKACETVDQGLGRLVEVVRAKGGSLVVIADHGNAEKMLTEDGRPHTAHTTNPVPCIVIGDKNFKLRDGGALCDVAPTLLELMGLAQPAEMTGTSLIVH